MSDNYNRNRLAKNSILLYVRMLFTIWLNLYATRLTLANLGVEDMGVYGVVGSVVAMFAVFSGGITSAVQRFITFELGRKDGNPNGVFCSSLNIIFLLSGVLLILLEIGGLCFLKNKVNIPSTSISAASWVFHLSVLTCIVNLLSIPYNAVVIAHEKMNAFALISIVQTCLNCVAAYSLAYLDNRLLSYALFMALIGIVVRISYQVYCTSRFHEAKYHLIIDWAQMKQLVKFTGVSTVSGILGVISGQGVTLAINWTFGVSVNAVYGIAMQLKNSVLSFALNIQKAIAPQITKTYANGEMEIHKKLIYSGSKMQVFLIYFIIIPFLFRTEYIMKLWLGNIPEHAVIFAQCTVFLSLTYAAFEPMRTAVLATNRITKFMLVPDSIFLLVLPICYFAGKWTGNPEVLILSVVAMDIFACAIRILIATRVSCLNLRGILFNVIKPCVLVALCSTVCCYALSHILGDNIWNFLCLLAINSLMLAIIIPAVGLSKSERKQIGNIIAIIRNKVKI